MCLDRFAHDGCGKCLLGHVEVWLPKKALCGAATALNGQDVRIFLLWSVTSTNVGNLAVEVVGQNWSSEVISLFLEDWEVGRVAFSCHLSMDLLCQEKMDACWESSESLGFPSFTVFRVPGRKEEVF